MSDSEALSILKEGHSAFSSVMARRHRSIRMVRSEWMSGSHRVGSLSLLPFHMSVISANLFIVKCQSSPNTYFDICLICV